MTYREAICAGCSEPLPPDARFCGTCLLRGDSDPRKIRRLRVESQGPSPERTSALLRRLCEPDTADVDWVTAHVPFDILVDATDSELARLDDGLSSEGAKTLRLDESSFPTHDSFRFRATPATYVKLATCIAMGAAGRIAGGTLVPLASAAMAFVACYPCVILAKRELSINSTVSSAKLGAVHPDILSALRSGGANGHARITEAILSLAVALRSSMKHVAHAEAATAEVALASVARTLAFVLSRSGNDPSANPAVALVDRLEGLRVSTFGGGATSLSEEQISALRSGIAQTERLARSLPAID